MTQMTSVAYGPLVFFIRMVNGGCNVNLKNLTSVLKDDLRF